jgi:serine/threonine protein kinase
MTRIAPAIERLIARPDGERTLGAFVLVKQLGKGGFAPVWLAKEVYGGAELRTVAVKLFAVEADMVERPGSVPPPRSRDSGTVQKRERIVEEARALSQVEHPNVVRFYSIHDDPNGGVVALVMEYVRGTPLDQELALLEERGERMPIDDVLGVGIAIASALSAVHQVGLVHRDIKPANVVDAGGVFKLIDFGIAAADRKRKKRPDDAKKKNALGDVAIEEGTKLSELAKTALGDDDVSFSLTGTMGYIDPACIDELSPATAASDLYALGATLY